MPLVPPHFPASFRAAAPTAEFLLGLAGLTDKGLVAGFSSRVSRRLVLSRPVLFQPALAGGLSWTQTQEEAGERRGVESNEYWIQAVATHICGTGSRSRPLIYAAQLIAFPFWKRHR